MNIIQVVAAIIKIEDKIFITRRDGGKFHDMWEFPGGKIEVNETREEALIREINEELELDIKVEEFLTTVDYDYPNFHLTMHCFICEVIGGELNLTVHNDAKWINLDEIDNQVWVPADILVVEAIKNKVK